MKRQSFTAIGARTKRLIFGSQEQRGWLLSLTLYLILIFVSFVFLYPILLIISGSAKDVYDLANPIVRWIPTQVNFDNYVKAYNVLGGLKNFFITVALILSIALAQTASAALVGYGLAKYSFWGRTLLMALLIATFILPPQTTFLARYVMFNNLEMIGTIFPVLIPSLLGQGMKSAIFILIFYQFFKMSPKSLDEAGFIDGAGHLKTFLSINMRLATPAVVVVFIFSFVWNWNETYLSSSYYGTAIQTLPLALERFSTYFSQMYPLANSNNNPMARINEGIKMAGTLLTILPLIVMYIVVERQLIESVDRAGITGE